jgi:hypothetical protein
MLDSASLNTRFRVVIDRQVLGPGSPRVFIGTAWPAHLHLTPTELPTAGRLLALTKPSADRVKFLACAKSRGGSGGALAVQSCDSASQCSTWASFGIWHSSCPPTACCKEGIKAGAARRKSSTKADVPVRGSNREHICGDKALLHGGPDFQQSSCGLGGSH